MLNSEENLKRYGLEELYHKETKSHLWGFKFRFQRGIVSYEVVI